MKFYNRNVKEDFLNEYNEATRIYYSRIFAKSFEFEHERRKDICNFNFDEIRIFLRSLNPETPEASRTNGRVVSAYLNWSIKHGCRKQGNNPLLDVPASWFDDFAVNPLSRLITYEQLQLIKNHCNNYQDHVILALLFDGIEGREASEIRYLKKDDVSRFDNTITVTRNNVRTKIKVMDSTMDAILGAIKEQSYLKLNGEASLEGVNQNPYLELIDSEFVMRNSKTRSYGTSGNAPITRNTLYRRLNAVRKGFSDGELEFMRAKNLLKSGMVFMGKRDYVDNGIALGKEQLQEIAVRFGMNERDHYRIKEWVNEDVINALYSNERSVIYN